VVLAAAGGGCQQGRPAPVPIALDEDACALCRMAVSQLPFAAEVALGGGVARTFDDVGCLQAWLRREPLPEKAAVYVVDFETHGWLEAERAFYLRSRELPTPMSSGIAAFVTRDAAVAAQNRWPGDLLSWEQIRR
jgi:copper chaperone NosL